MATQNLLSEAGGKLHVFGLGPQAVLLSSPADAWAPALVFHVLHICVAYFQALLCTSVGEAPSCLSSRTFFGNIEKGELDTP